jgi:peroxiredoxin family protein
MSEFVTKEEFSKLQKQVEDFKGQENKVSLLVFSGSLDKLLAAFIIATGAAASGMNVSLFLTFWGTSAFKKSQIKKFKKPIFEKMMGWVLPRGTDKLPLSQMNMAGLGPELIRSMMKKKNVASLEELIEASGELGVKINICEMSMGLMGILPEEIRDYPHLGYAGVATFLEEASKGKVTLFI